jgi:glucose/arabinose dehydrogenase
VLVLVVGAVVVLLLCLGAGFFLFGVRVSETAVAPVTSPVVVAPVAPPAPPPPAPTPPSPVKKVLELGEHGTNPGQLDDAAHLAVTPDGSIFVADSRSARVQKFDPAGKYVDLLTVPDDKLTKQHGIFGLASDVKGRLYVNRVGDVLVYDGASLKPVRTIAGSYPDRYFHGGLAVDASGTLYALTDRTGDVDLLALLESGKQRSRRRVHAHDVAVDGTGHVFLIGDDGLEVQDLEGKVQSKVGGVSGRSLAFDGKGHVFVATGSEVEVLNADGTKLVSLPVSASDVALDASGRLFALSRDHVTVYDVTLP